MEAIIRPYQTRQVTPPTRIITEAQSTAAIVLVAPGRSGTGKVFHGSYSLKVTHYMDRQIVEKDLES